MILLKKKTTTSLATFAAATALFASVAQVVVQAQEEDILGYVPMTPVHDIQNIATDISTIGKILDRHEDSDAFEQALRVYSEGGYSESVAKLDLLEGLRYFIDKGTVVSGMSISGTMVTGVVMDDYVVGDKKVEIFYNQDIGCYVGGLPKPDTRGCFEAEGQITVEGENEPFLYFYNVFEDNVNLRTIQHLSTKAEDEFKVNGEVDHGWFGEFYKFEEYYGSPTYADELVLGAFRKQDVKMKKHNYRFSTWTPAERAWMAEHGPDFMNIAMHIVGQLEQAKSKCVEGCSPTCNQDSIAHLDNALAMYTGSHINNEDEGNMLYALADEMCVKFKTCGWSVNATSGTSHVNLLNMVKFKAAQSKMAEGQCESADVDMRIIAKMVFIPLWQGLMQAAYHGYRHEAAVYAIATLPILAHCSPGHVEKIAGFFLPDSKETIHFPQMKKIMEDHYHCTMLDCRNMGGLWLPGENRYHGHAEPCDPNNAHAATADNEGPAAGAIVGVIGLLMCFALLGFLVIRRKRWNAAAKQSGEDPDAEDEPPRGARGEII